MEHKTPVFAWFSCQNTVTSLGESVISSATRRMRTAVVSIYTSIVEEGVHRTVGRKIRATSNSSANPCANHYPSMLPGKGR